MFDTLLLRLSLHFTQPNFISSCLNFTHLHFYALSFGLTPLKFPTATFHRTSLHFTALLDDFCPISTPFLIKDTYKLQLHTSNKIARGGGGDDDDDDNDDETFTSPSSSLYRFSSSPSFHASRTNTRCTNN